MAKLEFDRSGVEFIHSSEIIIFFFFFASLLQFIFTVIKIFVKKENFNEEENNNHQRNYNQPGVQSNVPPPPRIINADAQQEKINLDDINVNNDQMVNISPQINDNQGLRASEGPIKSSSSLNDFSNGLIFQYMPFMSIMILNILSFGSYIFLAFMTFFWFFSVILINYLKIFEKYGIIFLQHYAEYFHLVIVLAGFINYFVNDQNTI